MRFFLKRNKLDGAKVTDTIIGESTIVEGKIVTEASLRIEGQVHGDVESSGSITVGEQAELHSNLYAKEVTVAGKVHGSIMTKGKLLITSTGEINGTLDVGTLVIQEGGILIGTSKMHPQPHEERNQPKLVGGNGQKKQKSTQENLQEKSAAGGV